MTQLNLETVKSSTYDLIVCGGGLAGLTLARQLRRNRPELRILVVEKSGRPLPAAAHKVGESSVELGSRYLEQIGLREYLHDHHLFKHGLRFFPGGGHLPLEQRAELGPAREPVVASYQIDRGRFEDDLRAMIEADGVHLLEGASVGDIVLRSGGEAHEVEVSQGEARARLSCRWLVDATGRNALLRRRMKLTRGNRHTANAGWFRVRGKVDITDFVPQEQRAWHEAEWAKDRWRSTNHLMGEGYWVWIIPLSSGHTSIGIVVHDEVHGFDSVRTLERARAFIESNEPVLARELERREVLDFRCLRGYSHGVARCWSADRWAIVGEAGAFVDPLYSPGTDFIALANTFTEEMMRIDAEGGDLDLRARELNMMYRALVSGTVDLFRGAAKVYAHPRAMLAKVYWDNFSYWSYPCQLFLQGLYRLSGRALDSMIPVGQRFVELSNYVQALVGAWAELLPDEGRSSGFYGMPAFPSVLIDAHLALQESWSVEETLAYMTQRAAEGEEIVGELLVRLLAEAGDEQAEALFEAAGAARWRLRIDDGRIEALYTVGLARRRALSPLARDVERTLGRAEEKASKERLRQLLQPLLSSQRSARLGTAPKALEQAAAL